jgi:lipopolysaccharide export system protein LptA
MCTAQRTLPRSLALACIVWVSVACHPVAAQGGARVEVLNADEWAFDERIAGAQRLRGNVRFRHVDAVMRCDSAWLFEDNRVEAFGRVLIEQGDSLRAQGQRLVYTPSTRSARMEGDVDLRDRTMALSTPSLTYDLRNKHAHYSEGGRITDENGAVLQSRAGIYRTGRRVFEFTGNVRYDHPERTIRSDTMHYATHSGVAEFFGRTVITQPADTTTLRTTRGTYDTRTGRARFTRRSTVESKGRTLTGDSLHYDRSTGTGRAWGRVQVADTAAKSLALGDFGLYNERDDRAVITGRAELRLRMDPDTLYLHADTLFTTGPAPGEPRDAGGRVIARRGVRFFKTDLQGTCDTLVYLRADSLIRMYHQPALWNRNDQITGRHIRLLMGEGRPRLLYVDDEAFLISRLDSLRMDQVAGERITGHFNDAGDLHHLLVEGNGRTVYHVREKKDDGEELIGVNRAECGRIRVMIHEGEVATVTFLDRPEAVLHPPADAATAGEPLEGAVWRGAERPVDSFDIFRRTPSPVAP